MNKKPNKSIKKLSKGLDAIFGENFQDVISEIDEKKISKKDIIEIELNKIIPNPQNPRRFFSENSLIELASSISEHGLLSPIIVKETKNNSYYIVAGERRYRATKLNNSKTIKAIVLDIDTQKLHELAIIENLQREDLNPIEEALAFQNLINIYNMTHDDLSKKISKSRTYITNQLRLLQLDKIIIDYVIEGKLNYGHARTLIPLEKKDALFLVEKALANSWTVREMENHARTYSLRKIKKEKTTNIIKKNTSYEYVENLLRDALRTQIEVNKNKIIIKFRDDEQLNRILKRLNILED